MQWKKMFLVKSKGSITSIVRWAEVAIAITSKAAKAIIEAVAQAAKTTKAMAKATIVIAVVVTHPVRV